MSAGIDIERLDKFLDEQWNKHRDAFKANGDETNFWIAVGISKIQTWVKGEISQNKLIKGDTPRLLS